jgi:serine/threonine protein kinase
MNTYIYKCQIGSGNYSKVYKAIDTNTSEFVAIKKINKTKLSSGLISRFTKEIDILKSINHANIITIKDSIINDKHIFIITEYCNGGSLRDKMNTFNNENDIRFIIRQIVDGIVYLDSIGILHRDIKPDNILLMNESMVKIIDFGFSSDAKNIDMYSTICGTPMYMSPELLQNKEYTKKSDIWSLGIIAYELFHHKHPFGTPKNIIELLENINKNDILYKSNISLHFLEFIDSILQINASDRPSLTNINNHTWFNSKLKYNIIDSNDIFYMDDDLTEQSIQYLSKKQIYTHNHDEFSDDFEHININTFEVEEIPKSQPIQIINKKSDNVKIIENYSKPQTADYIISSSPYSPQRLSKTLIDYSNVLIKNIIGYTY